MRRPGKKRRKTMKPRAEDKGGSTLFSFRLMSGPTLSITRWERETKNACQEVLTGVSVSVFMTVLIACYFGTTLSSNWFAVELTTSTLNVPKSLSDSSSVMIRALLLESTDSLKTPFRKLRSFRPLFMVAF
jgi:hypothetical protein